MVRLFVHHRVEDYEEWRRVYDGFDREALGVRAHAVYQTIGDPNEVTVWHDFDDQATAESFADSAELKDAMKRAGVKDPPHAWITNET